MKKIQMTKCTNLTIADAYELFIRKCNVKNLSSSTITYYQQTLSHFLTFLHPETPISDINSNTIDAYVLWLRNNSKANDITTSTYLRSVRAFMYYCMECGYIADFKINLPKAEKKIKQTYSDIELEVLLKKPDIKHCNFSEYKTWVFINYLCATGNRISSAINVRIKDIDFQNYFITIQKTKNRQQQLIPLSHTLADILREYLNIRGGEPDDYLFCSNYGTKSSIRNYQDLVRNYNISRNINKVSCHLFRHTFAKKWIIAGGDIIRLQKILGHSDLSVTKEYLQMFGQDLQIDFEKFCPLDRLSSAKGTRIRL